MLASLSARYGGDSSSGGGKKQKKPTSDPFGDDAAFEAARRSMLQKGEARKGKGKATGK